MKISFLGAARTVTGSCYIIDINNVRFAVDCGLHQGNKEIEKRNKAEEYSPASIQFFLITHAHLDHSGLLPLMVKEGFRGQIYCTPPTADFLGLMLQDSAFIQESEAAWESKKQKRKGKKAIEPLYTREDAARVSRHIQGVEYNKSFSPAPGIRVCYKDAGHILGSAFLEIELTENGHTKRFVFSGDLGKPDSYIVPDPQIPTPPDYLFVESTYGDRDHKEEHASLDELAEAIAYGQKHNEKIIIPAFALERAQEVLYSLFLLQQKGQLPLDMPIFLDSPLAIKATAIFRRHPSFADSEMHELLQEGHDPLNLPNLRMTSTVQESQAINAYDGSAIIISASGMCNAGRIKHHLRHNIWKSGASIVFTGYQAMGTPGRHIVDGAQFVNLFGERLAIKAKIFTIGGFSAHAGQSQILDWVGAFAHKNMQIFLTHGEEKAQNTLAALLAERFSVQVSAPEYLEELSIDLAQGVSVQVKPENTSETHTLTPQATEPRKANAAVSPVFSRRSNAAEPTIDWDKMLKELSLRVQQLETCKEALKNRPWAEQTELRDNIIDINNELSICLSEIK